VKAKNSPRIGRLANLSPHSAERDGGSLGGGGSAPALSAWFRLFRGNSGYFRLHEKIFSSRVRALHFRRLLRVKTRAPDPPVLQSFSEGGCLKSVSHFRIGMKTVVKQSPRTRASTRVHACSLVPSPTGRACSFLPPPLAPLAPVKNPACRAVALWAKADPPLLPARVHWRRFRGLRQPSHLRCLRVKNPAPCPTSSGLVRLGTAWYGFWTKKLNFVKSWDTLP